MVNTEIWRIDTCKKHAGYRSNASIYALVKAGLWPRPVQIGIRSVGWPAEEVQAICRARIAEYDNDRLRALVDELHAKRADLLPQV
jgi:prophage regulatory protein